MRLFLISILFLLFFLDCRSQDAVTYKEDFLKDNGDWQVGQLYQFNSEIRDGSYFISRTGEDGYTCLLSPVYLDLTKDFIIETKIRQMSGFGGAGYGLVFGAKNDSSFYALLISSTGAFRVARFDGSEDVGIIQWQPVKGINPTGTPNVLRVRKSGGQLIFGINGQEVWSVNTPKFYGLNLGFMLGGAMTVAADYLGVKQDGIKINLIDNPINGYVKENLGPAVNSQFDEVNPVISADGGTLYVTRKNHPDNVGSDQRDDVWLSKLMPDGKWSEMKNIGRPVNNEIQNGVISVSSDNNTLLLLNTYRQDGSPLGKGISMTQRTRVGWAIPTIVRIKGYYNWNKHTGVCLSFDKTLLVIAMERQEGLGCLDLYVCFADSNGFTAPLNLGPVVNSMLDDFAPFLAADNKTLYFATDGKPGYGKADIFVTKRLDDSWTNWSEPQNLGPEINSPEFDAYYKTDAAGEYAYLVSKKKSIGGSDVFRIRQPLAARPEPVVLVSGTIVDSKTSQPVAALVEFHDLETNKLCGTATTDPVSGTYRMALPYGKTYSINSYKKNYFPVSDTLDVMNIKGYTKVDKNLSISPIAIGEVIRMNNIFFDVDKSILKKISNAELDRLVKLLKQYPLMEIEISGHTDSDGNDQYNLSLSQSRVKSVADYLVANGIAAKRLTAKGYGESKPIADNTTIEGKAKNRRVEFRILKM